MSDIYRKSALEKLQSPEQLDKMIRITSPMFWIAALGGGLIIVAALIWSIFARLPINVSSDGIFIGKGGIGTVYSADYGIIDEVLVKEGDTIGRDQVIAKLAFPQPAAGGTDAMSAEPDEIRSSLAGRIVEMTAEEGNAVSPGSPICHVSRSSSEGDNTVICYVPATKGRKIQKGMKAEVYPTTVNRQEYGHMNAVVSSVDEYVTSQENIRNKLADPSLVEAFTGSGPVVGVVCDLEKDASTESGYKWSSRKGAEVTLDPGTMVSVDIVTEEKAPITMLIPLLKEKLSVQRGNMPDE